MTWGARECLQRLASTLHLKRDQPHFACGEMVTKMGSSLAKEVSSVGRVEHPGWGCGVNGAGEALAWD